ncbi:hypothetical protein [Haliea atlantica]
MGALLAAGLSVSAQAQMGSLTTTYAGGNGQNGNMFDVVAANDITVTGFDINCDTAGPETFEVYSKQGSYVGSGTTPGDWTLLATATDLACNSSGTPTPLGLNLNVAISAGATQAFYITGTGSPPDVSYTDGTAVGSVAAQNTDLQILEGAGVEYPFVSLFEPRIWNGTLYYQLGTLAPQSIPTLPLLGLGILGGLLSLVAARRLRRAA